MKRENREAEKEEDKDWLWPIFNALFVLVILALFILFFVLMVIKLPPSDKFLDNIHAVFPVVASYDERVEKELKKGIYPGELIKWASPGGKRRAQAIEEKLRREISNEP